MTDCTACGHPEHMHGDRAIGGSCDAGDQYPNTCDCKGWTR